MSQHVTLDERQKINHKLKKIGFGGLDDVNIIQQIATLYPNHDSFRGLLMATRPDQRRIAYESLRPHLAFVPKPLDVYEQETKLRAEKEQWDVIDHNNPHFPRAFQPGEVESEEYRLDRLATEAIQQNAHEKHGGLELICTKCTKAELFRAKTRKEAEKDSHAAGWRSDGRKTYCPEHIPGRATMTIRCTQEGCLREEKIRCWDRQDAYARARLLGWVIVDSVTCARCATAAVLV